MDTELEKFKTDIELPYFAELYGFRVIKAKSSVATIAMENPANKETYHFFLNRKNKHFMFKNIHDEKITGSIIDFVKNVDPSLNLGHIRKLLRPHANISQKHYPLKAVTYTKKQNQHSFEYYQSLQKNHPFLIKRGFKNKDLFNPLFINCIGASKVNIPEQNKSYDNVIFPLKIDKKIVGLDVRNDQFKQLAQHSNKSEGIWFSNQTPHSKIIQITESPIDSISHHALIPNKSHLYTATSGNPSENQIHQIKKKAYDINAESIALANDNDSAGTRHNIKILNLINNYKKENQQCNFEIKLERKNFVNITINISNPLSFGAQSNIFPYKQTIRNEIININKTAAKEQIIAYEKPVKLSLIEETPYLIKLKLELRNINLTLKKIENLLLKISDNPHIIIEKPISKDWNQDLKNIRLVQEQQPAIKPKLSL